MEPWIAEKAPEQGAGKPRKSPWSRYEEAVLGFRSYWYPAMVSRRLGRKPVSVVILGERLLFIRCQGRCYALEDRCAHRGVPLSVGRCEFPGTATISCRYHGWTYDIRSGVCVGALTDGPDSPMVGKVRIGSYAVEERKGLIWVFMGDGKPPRLEEDVAEEFLDERAVMGVRVTLRRGNWRLAAENGLDPAHAAYLHRSAWLTFLRRFPAFKTDVVPEIQGPWVGYTQGPPVMECHYPNLGRWPADTRHWWRRPRSRGATKTQLRLPGYLRVSPFPTPGVVHFEWYVPVDESHHRYFQFSVKWTAGVKAWRFRLAYWLWWRWLAHVQFNGQDAWMVKLMEPFYSEEGGWQRERLFRPDVGLTTWRKHCHEHGRQVQRGWVQLPQNGGSGEFSSADGGSDGASVS